MMLPWIHGNKNRKKEIKKIIRYAKDILGIKIKFVSAEAGEMEGFSGLYSQPEEGEKAMIECVKNSSPLTTILILIHEIGHHIDYIKRGSPKDEEQAYNRYPDSSAEAPCPEEYVKKINYIEEQAVKYGLELADFLDIKLPVYSTVKDVIFSREMLNLQLKKGFTNGTDMRKIKQYSSQEAKRILRGKKYKRISYSICCQ